MKKIEYAQFTLAVGEEEIAQLNRLGSEGWILCFAVGGDKSSVIVWMYREVEVK